MFILGFAMIVIGLFIPQFGIALIIVGAGIMAIDIINTILKKVKSKKSSEYKNNTQ